ncbi:unnamed protein product [Soboliphyme baturini]|uniref:Reverse transcriptase domain-containing protein n=1 Tax=Soboliphyme baturini TaxID=241478 RepID=A0A183ITX6_9BILA|nr:unnamed protein product [Soboliphyme baturini]
MCFVELDKAYDLIPREGLWVCLKTYGVDGRLLEAVPSLYVHSRCCVKKEAKEQAKKIKYLGGEFTDDRKLEAEIDQRIGVAFCELTRTVVTLTELNLKTKLSAFKSNFLLELIYSQESENPKTPGADKNDLWQVSEEIYSRVRLSSTEDQTLA